MNVCPIVESPDQNSLLNLNIPIPPDLLGKVRVATVNSNTQVCYKSIVNDEEVQRRSSSSCLINPDYNQMDLSNVSISRGVQTNNVPLKSILKSPQQAIGIQTDTKFNEIHCGNDRKSASAMNKEDNICTDLSSYFEGKSYNQICRSLKVSRNCDSDRCIFKSKLEPPERPPRSEKLRNSVQVPQRAENPEIGMELNKKYGETILEETPVRIPTSQRHPRRIVHSQQPQPDIKLSPIPKRKKSKIPIYKCAYEVNDLNSSYPVNIIECIRYIQSKMSSSSSPKKQHSQNLKPKNASTHPKTQNLNSRSISTHPHAYTTKPSKKAYQNRTAPRAGGDLNQYLSRHSTAGCTNLCTTHCHQIKT